MYFLPPIPRQIIFKMLEENPRDVGQEMDEINIYYGDESLPHLYEHSHISSDQLPRQSGSTNLGIICAILGSV